MNQPFDLAWLERDLNRSTRTVLVPGAVLTLLFAAGTVVSLARGWRTEWPALLFLLLLAGLPGLWLLRIGLSPSASHPLLRILREKPSLIDAVSIEWRGAGGHYRGQVIVRVRGGRRFTLMAPQGREEELAGWLRGQVSPGSASGESPGSSSERAPL